MLGIALFKDLVQTIVDVVLDSNGLCGTLSGTGESLVWTDASESWMFVRDGIGSFAADKGGVVKLVGVEVTDIADVLVLLA